MLLNVLFFLLVASKATAFSRSYSTAQPVPSRQRTTALYDSHEFWRKERSKAEVESHIQACLDDGKYCVLQSRVQVLSAEPPLVIIHDFLSETMCRDIIETAATNPNMKRSTTGESRDTSDSRTSSTVWLRDNECKVPLRLIADKVSSISGLPPSHMENLQVCRYMPGQEFKLHTDHQRSFNDIDCRGRLATCLLYLSEPDAGGETWFPSIANIGESSKDTDEESQTRVAPTRGSALFFWNTAEKPGAPGYEPEMDLTADMRLLHAGLPVEKGEKWICNRFVHPIDFEAGVRGMEEPRYD